MTVKSVFCAVALAAVALGGCAGGPAAAPVAPAEAVAGPVAAPAPAADGQVDIRDATRGNRPAPTNAEELPADPNEVEVLAPEVERPAPPTLGDPRTPTEIMNARRAWNRCIARADRIARDSAPSQVAMDSPEELCRRSLGMQGPDDIPASQR